MLAARPVDVVIDSEEIADRLVIAAGVRARLGDLGCAVRCRGPRDYDCADGRTRDPAGDIDGNLAGEVIGSAGKAEARGVEQVRREDVLLLSAHHLLTEPLVDGRVG